MKYSINKVGQLLSRWNGYLTKYTKVNSRWISSLNMKSITLKLGKEKEFIIWKQEILSYKMHKEH